jgi:CspA family cold shock protein
MNMTIGTVKWFSQAKGYGFIQPDAGGNDVFLHITAVKEAGIENLNENDRVEFETATSRGKVSATNLRKLKK